MVAITAVLVSLAAPLLKTEIEAQENAAGVLLSLAAYVCVVILLLAPILTLGWFVFRIWGRAYWRAWRIRRIRNDNEMRQAVLRNQQEK
jgi:hypothetical protein